MADALSRRCVAYGADLLGQTAGRHAGYPHQPHGQYLERLPVHGDVQPVALRPLIFESGIGRGMGFRDSNQDLLGFVPHDPGTGAGARILDLAATQLASRRGLPPVPAADQARQQRYRQRLQRRPALAGPRDGRLHQRDRRLGNPGRGRAVRQPARHANSRLYEHLQRSLRYTLDRLGPHGLPLIGRADWNDCLNLNCFSDTPGQSFQTTTNKDGKVAEIVFIAGLFVAGGRRNGGDGAISHAGDDDQRAGTARPATQMENAVDLQQAGTANGSCAPTTISASKVGSHGMRGRPDLHRAAGDVRDGRHRPCRRTGRSRRWSR